MNYEKIEPNRPGMEPLPVSDTLLRFEDGTILRLRLTAQDSEGQLRNTSAAPGTVETVNVKLQCSVCKDDSGDVREDGAGQHLLLAAEVHGITVERLASGSQSFEAWLADRTDDVLQKARRKARVLDQVLAKFRVPEEAAVTQS